MNSYSVDYAAILASMVPGSAKWEETDGPESGVGIDRWFGGTGPSGEELTASINDDQGYISIQIYPYGSDEDEVLASFQGEEDELRESNPEAFTLSDLPDDPSDPEEPDEKDEEFWIGPS